MARLDAKALQAALDTAASSRPGTGGWGRFLALVLIAVALVLLVVVIAPYAGRSVTLTVPSQPAIGAPQPTTVTQFEMEVLQSGASWDAQIKGWLLYAADRLLWVALAVFVVGLLLWLLPFTRDAGVATMWVGGIGTLAMLLLPVLIMLVAGALDIRDGYLATGLHPTPGPPR